MAATKFNKPIDNEISSLNSNITTLNDQIANELEITTISTDTDFNTLTRAGYFVKWYCGEWRTGHTNGPTGITNGTPFSLEVIPIGASAYSKQILHIYGQTATTYMRTQGYNGGVAWYNWRTITTNAMT